ncbi:MAG: hypothetical protein ACRD3W_16010, partial [Terriglobales bacterium]
LSPALKREWDLRTAAEEYLKQKDYAKAIMLYRHCLRKEESAWAHDGLAKAMEQSGRKEEAKIERVRAKEIKKRIFNEIKNGTRSHGDFTEPDGKVMEHSKDES